MAKKHKNLRFLDISPKAIAASKGKILSHDQIPQPYGSCYGERNCERQLKWIKLNFLFSDKGNKVKIHRKRIYAAFITRIK
jgi:hypothetical protein